jgi:hypothetical protein
VVSFTPRPFYPQGKSPWCTLDRRLCGPQNRSGRGGEEKNSQPLPGLEPLIIQPVAQPYTTELSRPHFYKVHFNITSRSSSVSTVTMLRAGQPLFGSWRWQKRNFSLHHRVQNGSGAHPVSYPLGIWGCFPGGKAVGL